MRKFVIFALSLLLFVSAGLAKTPKSKNSERKHQASEQKAAAKADINTSSETELEALKGVGPATAKKIIDNRPYSSIDDLKKAGLSQSRIDKLRDSLTVSAAVPPLGSAPAAETKSNTKKTDKATSTTADNAKKPSLWDRLTRKKPGSDSTQTSAKSTDASATQQASSAPAPGGGNGKVWVNTDTKVFHREGDRWYGKTKHGEYMSEKDAIAAGYRPVKEREKKQ